MEMSNEWHLLIVGGACNGQEFRFAFNETIVVGRSHRAVVRLPKTDSDVSGLHAEFSLVGGVAEVKNLSQKQVLKVNGGNVASGASCAVRKGDTVELGSHVRIRLDSVPEGEATATISDETAAGKTEATRFLSSDNALLDVPTAVMEESSVGSTGGGIFASSFRQSAQTVATQIPSGLFGETAVPASETFATRVLGDASGMYGKPYGATVATNVFDSGTVATKVADAMLSGDSATETGDGVSEEGNTVEAKTRQGSWEEIQAMKEALDRKRKFRRVVSMAGIVLVGIVLVAIYVFTDGIGVESGMAYPENAAGEPDVRTYAIRNGDGDILLKVDYPNHPNIAETEAQDNKGISVVSWYGKRRDVPYYLQLEVLSHPDELRIDLMDSVRRWFEKAESSGEGYVFDERMRNELKPMFFEDVYPGSCQIKTLYGVRFLEFEYKRTWPDGKLWHGVAHYFRSGDTVYLLRREIPEFYWVRGGYRIKADPNIAVYGLFSEGYWESPGEKELLGELSTYELMDEIRKFLSKERAADWRLVRRNIDTVLARTWRTDPKTRELAESCLRQFREVLRVYYNGKYNAFLTAKDNREEKKMRFIRQDVQIVFDQPDERYYFLVNNGEVW